MHAANLFFKFPLITQFYYRSTTDLNGTLDSIEMQLIIIHLVIDLDRMFYKSMYSFTFHTNTALSSGTLLSV